MLNNWHFCRLRVVPHFSSEIVERAKRERAVRRADWQEELPLRYVFA